MSTSTPTRPQPTYRPPQPADADQRPRFFGLSLTQLLATAFAAVTATVAGSYLGVTGTVAGAALASVVSAVGNAVYVASIRRTRDTVRAVVPGPAPRRAAGRPPRPGPRDPAPVLPSRAPRRPRPGRAPTTRRAMPWRGVALGSIGMFLAVLAGVTVTEAIAGRPLTDLVRGDGGSGTTVFGGSAPKHSTTPSVLPTVTQTVTQPVTQQTTTASTHTTTVTPSVTVTASPTASDGASASHSASESPKGSASQLP